MANSRVREILHNNTNLNIEIIDARKSVENHTHLQSLFIVYSIRMGELIVKRRYSEFESLRNVLIKCYLTKIIPPIPEKQTLSSNLQTSTNLGLNNKGTTGGGAPGVSTTASSSSPMNISNNANSSNGSTHSKGDSTTAGINSSTIMSVTGSGGGGVPGGSGGGATNSNSNGNGNQINFVEYRKRMLSVFLSRCLESIPGIRDNQFFINFLDPEINFSDYLVENSHLHKFNKYKLSVYEPLLHLDDQIYITLPTPSSSHLAQFPELINDELFQEFNLILKKFEKYEYVLDSISKTNKRLMKHLKELNVDYSDLGSNFNRLSLIQDSDFIEEIGKTFERKLIYSNALVELINLKFLDKLLELKSFTRIIKELVEFNRKKVTQFKLIEKELYESRVKYKGYEKQQEEIDKIDKLINNVDDENDSETGPDKNTVDSNSNGVDPPITDSELQNALYISSSKNSLYGKIPYFKKINNAILKYTDNDPNKTRKDKMYQLKLRIYQLERQYDIVDGDNSRVNKDVLEEITNFHNWFKGEVCGLIVQYNSDLEEFLKNNEKNISY